MPTFAADQLQNIATCIFVAAGAPEATARRVSASLVLCNLMGVDSHGVIRIPQYLEGIRSGTIDPHAHVEIVKDNGVAVVLDGHNAFGQVAAEQAMRAAIERARRNAVGAASLFHVSHIGRLGEWAEMAADAGMFGWVLASGTRPGGLVAPYGSRQRVLGTNPLSYAVPSARGPAMVADFATSMVAEGKVRSAQQQGKAIPSEWAVDNVGRPTSDPCAFYNGGALQTFGGHKGYALSLMVEVLGGILSGGGNPCSPKYTHLQNGTFMLALDVGFFCRPEEYEDALQVLCAAVKGAAPADGFSEVLLPGEIEGRRKAERERGGIPVPEGVWNEICAAARQVGVEL